MDNLPQKVSDIKNPPPSDNVGKQIIFFGLPTCPDCLRIKKFFSENAITYEYHDVQTNRAALLWINEFTDHVPVLIMLDGTMMYSPSNDQLLEKIQGTSVNGKVSAVSEDVFDVVIIGAGPAGVTAAIYAVRKALKTLVLTKNIGGQASFAPNIQNYTGFTLIQGYELAKKFKEDLKQFQGDGLYLKENVSVKSIEGSDGNFTIKTEQSNYKAKTVIIASGRTPKMLGIPGEKELFGKGVVTCATCDGPFYKGKDIVVIGGGNSAMDAAVSLVKQVKQLTIINISPEITGDAVLLNQIKSSPNVKILNNTKTLEILGSERVEGVKVQNENGEQTIPCSGVFVEIGWAPTVDFAPMVNKNERGEVIVDEYGKTNVPGIYAAGDVNNLWGDQIIIAAGEGAKVALAVNEHVMKIPHQMDSNIHTS